MEGKLITTEGLKAYTQQLKTFIDNTYQTKADMALYTKTANLFTDLDKRYIIQGSSLYGNPIYKHTVNVVSENNFSMSLTIFTTRATQYNNANEFSTDWVANRKIISVLADGIKYSAATTLFQGTVVGVTSIYGDIAVRISGIDSTMSNWDQTYTLNRWSYSDQQSNPGRI